MDEAEEEEEREEAERPLAEDPRVMEFDMALPVTASLLPNIDEPLPPAAPAPAPAPAVPLAAAAVL